VSLPALSELSRQHELPDVASRYIDLQRTGSEYEALCPFHADRNPSLRIYQRRSDGSWRYKCFACGAHGDTVDFVREIEGVDTAEAARRLRGEGPPPVRIERPAPAGDAELWAPVLPVPTTAPPPFDPVRAGNWLVWNPKRNREWSFRPAASWAYSDSAGRLLGWVARIDFDDGKITPAVTWCRNTETGAERWCMRPFPTPRPLLGLQDLAARPDAAVLVVSGEKCREVAARLLPSSVAVTWPGGDNGEASVDWSPLAGRRVTLWMDADVSGAAAGDRIARRLQALGCAVRYIDTEGQPKGWDIADAVADGWDRARVVEFCRERVRPCALAQKDEAPASVPSGEGSDAAQLDPQPMGGTTVATYTAAPDEGETSSVREYTRDGAPDATPIALRPTLHVVQGELVEPIRVHAALDETADPQTDDIPELYSEDNAALAFSRQFANDLRYVAPWGRWMIWRGQRWTEENTLHVFDLARQICRSVAAQARNDQRHITTETQRRAVISRYGLASTVAAVERLAKSDRRHAATIEQWDADVWALNTPAGVVDLRTGQIREGDRSAHMTKITEVAPGGECPAWLRFLDTACEGDAELIGFLQRMAGYALTGSTRDHALFFVYGTGGNGKGTFLNTLQWIMGDYARSAPADMFTERKHEAHTTELARLMGARLVAAQETEEGKRWAEAKIKALTGGDPVTARFMRQDDFEYIPQFKLVMTGNHKPGLRNVDEAIRRRLYLIPFEADIPAEKRDTSLAERLRAEAGGILAWAIQGCLQWQREGLRAPDRVRAATADYLEQQDVLGQWMAEHVTPKGGPTRRSELYKSFRQWAEDAGEYVLPQKRFVAALESRGFRSVLRDGIQCVEGVSIREREPWPY
jgi:P4 family phage/plasmid primase-like protien